MSFANSSITGIVRSALMIPPIPSVSAIVCLRPYFLGISKSVIVHGSYPPTWIAFTTKLASRRASLRFSTPRYVLIVALPSFTLLLIAFKIIAESSSLCASMSYNAISASQSAGLHIQSPSTLRAKTVLPAPKNVILIIVLSSL